MDCNKYSKPYSECSCYTCSRCEENPAIEAHTCPYAKGMHGDKRLCTCCDACTQQCGEDI